MIPYIGTPRLVSNYLLPQNRNGGNITNRINVIILAILIVACSTNKSENSDNCDPNYVGTCVPHSYGDLDCGDVYHKNFRVVGHDKHGFDRDGDRIACEKQTF